MFSTSSTWDSFSGSVTSQGISRMAVKPSVSNGFMALGSAMTDAAGNAARSNATTRRR
jgi:hypothetical protein